MSIEDLDKSVNINFRVPAVNVNQKVSHLLTNF